MAREIHVFTDSDFRWKNLTFTAEATYKPSVYTAKLSVRLAQELPDEDREALEQALIRILEERLKSDFKRMIEDTEESDGFLETGALDRLSDRLRRYVQRAVMRYKPQAWDSGID